MGASSVRDAPQRDVRSDAFVSSAPRMIRSRGRCEDVERGLGVENEAGRSSPVREHSAEHRLVYVDVGNIEETPRRKTT
jgi:hypothetical protein